MKTSPPGPLSDTERGNSHSHLGKGWGIRSLKTSPSNSLSEAERANSPSRVGKGSGVRSSPIFGQSVGPAELVRAKELRRTMTAAECLLWRALRANQLRGYHFRRQQIIDGFIADFYCHSAALVIEVDGPPHLAQADCDAERDAIMTTRGLQVVRVTNEQVLKDMEAVLARIEEMLMTSPSNSLSEAERENSPSRVGKGSGVRSLKTSPPAPSPTRRGGTPFPVSGRARGLGKRRDRPLWPRSLS
ncbi:MAG: endonuclease domain-containing protein [Chloroflexi bacterium]|nr:endonuclease domain-containing protein [Chloroflexota bacterium]